MTEQHFSVWLFFNPGDNTLFLLKFNEARFQSGTYKELKLATLTKNMCSQLNQDLGGDSILGKVVKVKYLRGHSL